ncbi:hypothetical protein FHE66_02760 [Georgenia sp. 311]|uniref:hypothetical protein n=1 Tax=Georgenia sp. 311 TaxID=2585134 RepID=UPI001111D47B|nr:hypothetical protein [Georgenia sp. 311]TNC19782.1 hypothetical protein FHE66_02760 [Georgenia sp. 311]
MDTYDEGGQRVIALSVEGEVIRDDEHWEGVVKDWEEEGVDPDLVELARPLLEGSAAQQKAARRVLSAARGNHRTDDEPVGKINVLLAEAGLADSATDLSGLYDLATGETVTIAEDQQDAVLDAWGQQHPDQQRQGERYWPGGTGRSEKRGERPGRLRLIRASLRPKGLCEVSVVITILPCNRHRGERLWAC